MNILLILFTILAVVVGYVLGTLSILPNHVLAERLKAKISILKEGKATFHSPAAKLKADQLTEGLENEH